MRSYLLNRRGTYYFRMRIPADLSQVIPYVELVKSLKTRDRKTAKPKHSSCVTSRKVSWYY